MFSAARQDTHTRHALQIATDLTSQFIHIVFADDREIEIIDLVHRVAWFGMTWVYIRAADGRTLRNGFGRRLGESRAGHRMLIIMFTIERPVDELVC